MIENELVARQISELMLEIGDRLDRSVELVQDNCPDGELAAYRQSIGTIMAEILLGVLNPLYAEHPSLKPPELD